MVDEPDNMTLRLLREIRGELTAIRAKQDEHTAKLEQHDARFDQVDRRFDHIDKELEELRFQVTYGLGVSSINHLKAREFDSRIADLDRRVKRLEEPTEAE